MKYIVFDIDGVLADSSEREQKYLIGKERKDINWGLFYKDVSNDEPIKAGILTATAFTFYSAGCELVFITGRNESVREQTIDWLSYQLVLDKEKINLYMRHDGDTTTNSKFKESIGEQLGFENIIIAFDDNGSTVDMWRSHGVTCYQTDKRDFKQNNY